MKKIILLAFLAVLLLSFIAIAMPGTFPYPVYGYLKEKDTGYAVRYAPVYLETQDRIIRQAVTDANGYFQFELSTAYLGQTAKIGVKGNMQEIKIEGNKLNINLIYSKEILSNAAIAGGTALILASVGGYYYFRRTIR